MSRLARLARRVGRKLKALAPTPRPPEPPSLPLVLDGRVPLAGYPTVRDVWCAPAFGVVVDRQGHVLGGAADEALRVSPDLAALPGVRVHQGQSRLILPDAALRLPKAAVIAGWGGLRNYAGFLLDTLPAFLAADQAGVLAEHPSVLPPLTPWQAELLTLTGIAAPQTLDAPWIELDEAVLTPALGPVVAHPMLAEVRGRVLTGLGGANGAGRKLYISRSDLYDAIMVDEAGVEIELAALGYTIVRPETSSARELIQLFAEADLIVAATGTALANLLFCPPGAEVVEIRPPGSTSVWVQNLATGLGLKWRGFDAEGVREMLETPLDAALRPAAAFAWRADVVALLAFLAQRA